jgi:hypothetical protein
MATDSVRQGGECHLGLALLFFTPSELFDVEEEEGELVALDEEPVLAVGTSPAPPLPPAVRGTGVAGLVSLSAFW